MNSKLRDGIIYGKDNDSDVVSGGSKYLARQNKSWSVGSLELQLYLAKPETSSCFLTCIDLSLMCNVLILVLNYHSMEQQGLPTKL
jgi:hypothetical protein